MEIKSSALVFHNYHEKVASYVELSQPFMLLYEHINSKSDLFNLIEFSDLGYYTVHMSYHDFIHLGNQPLHTHDFYEITYVLSGSLHMQIEDHVYIFSAGDCCICNQNVRHAEQNDSDCEFLLIMLQADFLEELLKLDNSNEAHHLLTRFIHKNSKEFATIYSHSQSPYIYEKNLSLINEILNDITEKKPGSRLYALGKLCLFLSTLQRQDFYEISLHQAAFSSKEDLFIRISLFIEAHYGNVTRTELEKHLGYNGDYLTRIIKSFTGLNFNTYAQEFSLREAKNRLLNTTETIGNICLSLGYNNRTYFNKLFKKKYGMPPNHYRNQKKELAKH